MKSIFSIQEYMGNVLNLSQCSIGTEKRTSLKRGNLVISKSPKSGAKKRPIISRPLVIGPAE